MSPEERNQIVESEDFLNMTVQDLIDNYGATIMSDEKEPSYVTIHMYIK